MDASAHNNTCRGPLGEHQGQAGGYARRQCARRGRWSLEAPPPERHTPCPQDSQAVWRDYSCDRRITLDHSGFARKGLNGLARTDD